jgi:hypothetical protein
MFGMLIVFSIVLSKKANFFLFHKNKNEIHWVGWSSPSSSEDNKAMIIKKLSSNLKRYRTQLL